MRLKFLRVYYVLEILLIIYSFNKLKALHFVMNKGEIFFHCLFWIGMYIEIILAIEAFLKRIQMESNKDNIIIYLKKQKIRFKMFLIFFILFSLYRIYIMLNYSNFNGWIILFIGQTFSAYSIKKYFERTEDKE